MSESNEVNFHVPYDNNVILLLVYFLFCIKDDYFILYTFSIFKMHCSIFPYSQKSTRPTGRITHRGHYLLCKTLLLNINLQLSEQFIP